MNDVTGDSAVLERLERIERILTEGLTAMNTRLNSAAPVIGLFNDGLEAYRTRLLHENRLGRIRQELLARISTDRTLRFPHRKILDFLLGEYDYNREQFTEVTFSRLVRECRVGKNRAQGYLSLLEQKGFVVRRTDGYRIFFKLLS